MKRNVFISLCIATVLALGAWPTSRARAQDDDDQGDDCGTTISAADDDQGDEDIQGDDEGCGMVVVDMDDENGDEVDDMNDDGTPDDDVDVDIEETVRVPGASQVTQVLQFHTALHGSFRLTGLPKGRVKITATRAHNGVTTVGHRRAGAREHHTRRVHLRLRPLPSQ